MGQYTGTPTDTDTTAQGEVVSRHRLSCAAEQGNRDNPSGRQYYQQSGTVFALIDGDRGRKNFLYILKAGLRAAACGDRPRPPARKYWSNR
jgi:hypothetical protein